MQQNDALVTMAQDAEVKLLEEGAESLTSWERGLVLHHWSAGRIESSNAELIASVSNGNGGKNLIKKHGPGAGAGVGLGAIIVAVREFLANLGS